MSDMLANYKLVTVSHRNLNTEDLAHFVLKHNGEHDLTNKLMHIKKVSDQDEILYLNTCNRVLFFFYGSQPFHLQNPLSFFKRVNPDFEGENFENLDRIVSYLTGNEAVNHLFEIASSIDSLVVGEREIFRQFRDAYNFSTSNSLGGDYLRLVEKMAVKAAKEVYTKTTIGTRPVSVVSLAIQYFLSYEIPKNARILLIGAGETNSTVGRFLRKHEYRNVVIFNRSLDNAHSLSEELNASAKHLKDLLNYKEGYDCIFACTASQEPILTEEIFDRITTDDRQKIVVDLSIPHNVSRTVKELNQVRYISIDDLRSLAEENLNHRSSNIVHARKILGVRLNEFTQLIERRKIEKALTELPEEINKVKRRALDLVFKDQIDALPEESRALINEIADYMEKKCIAAPMKLAKNGVEKT